MTTSTNAVPAVKTSRAPKKKTAAELQRELDEANALLAAKNASTGATSVTDDEEELEDEDLSLPLELTLDLSGGRSTLINDDKVNGIQIYMRVLEYRDSTQVAKLQYQMAKISQRMSELDLKSDDKNVSDAKAEELALKMLDLLEALQAKTEELGGLLFDDENNAKAQRHGAIGYQKLIDRALRRSMTTHNDTTKSTGN